MADGLLSKIKDSLDNLVTLEIVTAVGSVTQDADSGAPSLDYKNSSEIYMTKVDLLQGDLTTVVPDKSAFTEDNGMMNYHKERVQEAHTIVKDNIKALEQLVALVSSKAMG